MASAASTFARLAERLRQLNEEFEGIVQNLSQLEELRTDLQQQIEEARGMQASAKEDAQRARVLELQEALEARNAKVRDAEASRKEALREFARKTRVELESATAAADAEYDDLLKKLDSQRQERECTLRNQHDRTLNGLEEQLEEVHGRIQANEAKAEALSTDLHRSTGEPDSLSASANLCQHAGIRPPLSPTHDIAANEDSGLPGTIIPILGNKTVAISCKYCGANATENSKTFFKGAHGANLHVLKRHEAELQGSNVLYKSLTHLNVEELTLHDLELIKAGDRPFPMVFGDEAKNTPARKSAALPSNTSISPSPAESFGELSNNSRIPPQSQAKNDDQDNEDATDESNITVRRTSEARLKTPEIFPDDRQKPNGGREAGIVGFIHKRFASVVNVYHHGQWTYVEVSCAICEANTDADGNFFRGKTGLLKHVHQAHGMDPKQADISWRHIREVSERDKQLMAQGLEPQDRPITKRPYRPNDLLMRPSAPRQSGRKRRRSSPGDAGMHHRPPYDLIRHRRNSINAKEEGCFASS